MTCCVKALFKDIWSCWLLLLFLGCKPVSPPPAPAFIYWKTGWDKSPAVENYLTALPAERLWVRLFDVDLSPETGQAAPAGIWSGPLPPVDAQILEPVVFITVRCLEPEAGTDTKDLAGKIWQLASKAFSGKLHSLWVDCDWTPSTQAAYFDLLRHLRATLPAGVRLGSTLRLHQWAFPKATGIPPVDEVLLMAYNTGEVTDSNTTNSIIDPLTLDRWIPSGDYPLPLSLALPTWSWGVVFREGRWWQLLQPLDKHQVADTSRFQELPGKAHRVVVKKGTFLLGHYLYPGDLIRIESVKPRDLYVTAAWFRKHLKTPPQSVAFYHLHPEQTQKYPIDTLRDILDRFQQ